MAQGLRLQGSTARDTGLIPGQGSSAWCCQKQNKVYQSSARSINSHLSSISNIFLPY